MNLVLLLLLVESLSTTTVLSEEVETLPTTYSPTRRSMLAGGKAFVQGLKKIDAAVEEHGEEMVKQGKDVAEFAGDVYQNTQTSSYTPTSSCTLAGYILTVVMVYVLYA